MVNVTIKVKNLYLSRFLTLYLSNLNPGYFPHSTKYKPIHFSRTEIKPLYFVIELKYLHFTYCGQAIQANKGGLVDASMYTTYYFM